MYLTKEQIEKLEAFGDWFDNWPYSEYDYIENESLRLKLREIFPHKERNVPYGKKT